MEKHERDRKLGENEEYWEIKGTVGETRNCGRNQRIGEKLEDLGRDKKCGREWRILRRGG